MLFVSDTCHVFVGRTNTSTREVVSPQGTGAAAAPVAAPNRRGRKGKCMYNPTLFSKSHGADMPAPTSNCSGRGGTSGSAWATRSRSQLKPQPPPLQPSATMNAVQQGPNAFIQPPQHSAFMVPRAPLPSHFFPPQQTTLSIPSSLTAEQLPLGPPPPTPSSNVPYQHIYYQHPPPLGLASQLVAHPPFTAVHGQQHWPPLSLPPPPPSSSSYYPPYTQM